jgi:hypothetical protein
MNPEGIKYLQIGLRQRGWRNRFIPRCRKWAMGDSFEILQLYVVENAKTSRKAEFRNSVLNEAISSPVVSGRNVGSQLLQKYLRRPHLIGTKYFNQTHSIYHRDLLARFRYPPVLLSNRERSFAWPFSGSNFLARKRRIEVKLDFRSC